MGASMHVEPDPRQVFVVHGRDTAARGALFAFAHSIGLEPIEWAKAVQMSGEATPHIGTILNTAFEAARAVVVLLTPDEIVHLHDGRASGTLNLRDHADTARLETVVNWLAAPVA